jgi:hypothetical protein
MDEPYVAALAASAEGKMLAYLETHDPDTFRVFSVLATDRGSTPLVNFQAGMQQPGILQPAEADSTSIGRPRFTE